MRKALMLIALTALPAFAGTSPLTGQWSQTEAFEEDAVLGAGEATLTLTFGKNGAFEGVMEFRYDQDIFASLWEIQWLAMTEELGIPADSLEVPKLPVLATMSVIGKGAYSISDDGTEFTLSDIEEEVLINGKPHIDFFTDVGKVLVRFMALVLGISEEDYPAFEKEALGEFLTEVGSDSPASVWTDPETATTKFRIEGDTLFLIDEDDPEGTAEMKRVGEPPTVVSGTSWGELKNQFK